MPLFLSKKLHASISLLLVVALVTPSVAYAVEGGPGPTGNSSGFSGDPGQAGGPNTGGPNIGNDGDRGGSEYSGGGIGSDAGVAPDSDGDGTPDGTEHDQAQAAADAVSNAASISGYEANVSPVDTSKDPNASGSQVSVDGKTMSTDAALGYIGAMADATKSGSVSPQSVGVDREATAQAYADGTACSGCVVGFYSGDKAVSPDVAAKAAIDASIGNKVGTAGFWSSVMGWFDRQRGPAANEVDNALQDLEEQSKQVVVPGNLTLALSPVPAANWNAQQAPLTGGFQPNRNALDPTPISSQGTANVVKSGTAGDIAGEAAYATPNPEVAGVFSTFDSQKRDVQITTWTDGSISGKVTTLDAATGLQTSRSLSTEELSAALGRVPTALDSLDNRGLSAINSNNAIGVNLGASQIGLAPALSDEQIANLSKFSPQNIPEQNLVIDKTSMTGTTITASPAGGTFASQHKSEELDRIAEINKTNPAAAGQLADVYKQATNAHFQTAHITNPDDKATAVALNEAVQGAVRNAIEAIEKGGFLTGTTGQLAIDEPFNRDIARAADAAEAALNFAENASRASSLQEQKNEVANKFGAEARTLDAEIQAANMAKGAAYADAVSALSQSREDAVRANTLDRMADIAAAHAEMARNELDRALSVAGLEAQTRALDEAAANIARNAETTLEALREAAVRGNLSLRDDSVQVSVTGNLTSSRREQAKATNEDTIAPVTWENTLLTTEAIKDWQIQNAIALGLTPEQAVRAVNQNVEAMYFVPFAPTVAYLFDAFDYARAYYGIGLGQDADEKAKAVVGDLALDSVITAGIWAGIEVASAVTLGVVAGALGPRGISNLGREVANSVANKNVGSLAELPDYPTYNPNVGSRMSEYTVDVKTNYNLETGKFGAPEVSVRSIAANDNLSSPAAGAAAARDLSVAADDVGKAVSVTKEAAENPAAGTIDPAFQQALRDLDSKLTDAQGRNANELSSPQVQNEFADINVAIDRAKNLADNPAAGKVDPALQRALDNLEREVSDFAEQSARVAALNESPAVGAAAARDTANVTSLQSAANNATRAVNDARATLDAVDPPLQRALDQIEAARREFQDMADNAVARETEQALREMDEALGRAAEQHMAAAEAAQRVEDSVAEVSRMADDVARVADEDALEAAILDMEADIARAINEKARLSEINRTLDDSVAQLTSKLDEMKRAADEDAVARASLDEVEPSVIRAIDESVAASQALKNADEAVDAARLSTERLADEAQRVGSAATARQSTAVAPTGRTGSVASRAVNAVVAASVIVTSMLPVGPMVRAVTPNAIVRIADEAIDTVGSRTSRTNASLFARGERTFNVNERATIGRTLLEADARVREDYISAFNRNGGNVVAALGTLTSADRQAIGGIVNTISNRLDPSNPARDSIEEVVKAEGQFQTFRGSLDNPRSELSKFNKEYEAAKAAYDALATAYVDGTVLNTFGVKDAVPVPNATHYVADNVRQPRWTNNLNRVAQIGGHYFYTVEGTNQPIEAIDLAMNQSHLAAGSFNIANAIPTLRPDNVSAVATNNGTGYTPGWFDSIRNAVGEVIGAREAQGAAVVDTGLRQNGLGYVADTDFVLPMNGAVGGLLNAKGEPLGNTPEYGTARGRWHLGTDIYGLDSARLTGPSNPVLAFADAQITNVSRIGNYGWVIEMTATKATINGVAAKARYAHVANPAKYGIKEGMTVSKGQVLSHVTGSGTEFERAAAKHFFNDERAVGRLTDEMIMEFEDFLNKNGWPPGMAKPHLHLELRTAQGYKDRGINTVNPKTVFPAMQENQPFYAGASPDNRTGGLARIDAKPLENVVNNEQSVASLKQPAPLPSYDEAVANLEAKTKANGLVEQIRADLAKTEPAPKTLVQQVTAPANKAFATGVDWLSEKLSQGAAAVENARASLNQWASRQPAPEVTRPGSQFSSDYLKEVIAGPAGDRYLVSKEEAQAELDYRAVHGEPVKTEITPKTNDVQSTPLARYSQEYLEQIIRGEHSRPFISKEAAQKELEARNNLKTGASGSTTYYDGALKGLPELGAKQRYTGGYGITATQNAKPFAGVVTHHSASTLDSVIKEIETQRTGTNGNVGYFGYHVLIGKDENGVVQILQLAPENVRTNHIGDTEQGHVKSNLTNENSIGIAIVLPAKSQSQFNADSALTSKYGTGLAGYDKYIADLADHPDPAVLDAYVKTTRAILDNYGIKASSDTVQSHEKGPSEGVALRNAVLDSYKNEPAQVAKTPEQQVTPVVDNSADGANVVNVVFAPTFDSLSLTTDALGQALPQNAKTRTIYVNNGQNLSTLLATLAALPPGTQVNLIGWSKGAIAALYVANQLNGLGMPVANLLMIDPGQGTVGLALSELPSIDIVTGKVGVPDNVLNAKVFKPQGGGTFQKQFVEPNLIENALLGTSERQPNGFKGLDADDIVEVNAGLAAGPRGVGIAHMLIGYQDSVIGPIVEAVKNSQTQPVVTAKANQAARQQAVPVAVDTASLTALHATIKNNNVQIAADEIIYEGKTGTQNSYEFGLSDEDGTYTNFVRGEMTITTKEVNGAVTEFTFAPVDPNGVITVGLGQKLNSVNPDDFNTISGNMTITGKISNGKIGSLEFRPNSGQQITIKGKVPVFGEITRFTAEPIVLKDDGSIEASLGELGKDVVDRLKWYSERTPELVGKIADELTLINKQVRADGSIPQNVADIAAPKQSAAAAVNPEIGSAATKESVESSLSDLRDDMRARVAEIETAISRSDLSGDEAATLVNELAKIQTASSLLADSKVKADAGDFLSAQDLVNQAKTIFETRNSAGGLNSPLDAWDYALLGGIGLGIASLLSKLIGRMRSGGGMNPFARFNSARGTARSDTEEGDIGGSAQTGGVRAVAANDNIPTARNTYGKNVGNRVENVGIAIGILSAIALLIKSLLKNDPEPIDQESGASVESDDQDDDTVAADTKGKKGVFDRIKEYLGGGIDQTSTTATSTASAKGVVTVKVLRDLNSNNFDLQVTDVYASAEYADSLVVAEDEENEYLEDNQPSIIFNEYNEVVYSDGTYAPVTVDGEIIDKSGFEYLYLVEYYENDKPVTINANADRLPENFFTDLVSYLFQDQSSFTINDVSYITRAFYDPKPDVPRDELYEYTIILNDGSARKVVVPEFTSYAFLSKRFAEAGLEGDVLPLIAEAQNVSRVEDPSLLSETTRSIGTGFDYLRQLLGLDQESDTVLTNLDTLTPTNDGVVNMNDIRKATVFFGIEAECPDTAGLNAPYLYEIVIAKEALPDAYSDLAFRALRCGTGNKQIYANEIAGHLESLAGFGEIDRAALYSMLRFGDLSNLVFEEGTGTSGTTENPVIEEPVTEEEKPVIPNTTNEVSFEVKAINNSGTVLADWVYGDLEISSGVQLFFRWNGERYKQCLPFLNDNGLYALTRVSDPALTTGNTEAEGYNVKEGTLTYRIECGGQDNGEFGVDIREIVVTVN